MNYSQQQIRARYMCKLVGSSKFDLIAQSCLTLVIILSNRVQTADHAVFGDYFNEIIKLLGERWTVNASRIQSRGALISFGTHRLSLFDHFVTISLLWNNMRIEIEISIIVSDGYQVLAKSPSKRFLSADKENKACLSTSGFQGAFSAARTLVTITAELFTGARLTRLN